MICCTAHTFKLTWEFGYLNKRLKKEKANERDVFN